jgi:hypothetical protein
LISDPLYEIDGATPKLRILDAHERFDDRVPLARGEEVEYVGWRQ